jgi:hypothetical protein
MRSLLLLVALTSLAATAPVEAQVRWTVDARPLADITGTDASGQPLVMLPSGATRLASGTIVVADGTAPAIRFFGADGAPLRSAGRSGAGPGEYRTIAWMGQCAPDTLFVYDLYTRRLAVLDSAGRFVRQFDSPGKPGTVACGAPGVMAIIGDMDLRSEQASSRTRMRARVTLADTRGQVRATIDDVPFFDLAQGVSGPLPLPMGAVTTLAVTRDRLLVGAGDSAHVDVYDLAGRRTGRIALPVTTRTPTPAHREAAIEEFSRFATDAGMRRAMSRMFSSGMAAPARLPYYSAILADPDGVLWVDLSHPGDARTRLLAIGGDGRPVGEVEIAQYLKVHEIGRDHILGSRTDEDGEPHVTMYRLRRGR